MIRINIPIRLTSWHDGPDVLQREDRQLLLRVHPDHAVTQVLHGQHAASWRRTSLLHGPVGRVETASQIVWRVMECWEKNAISEDVWGNKIFLGKKGNIFAEVKTMGILLLTLDNFMNFYYTSILL